MQNSDNDLVTKILKSEFPIFEILHRSDHEEESPISHLRVYYNGRVEGFNDQVVGVINWYPTVRATISARARLTDTLHPRPDAKIPSETVQSTVAHLHSDESDQHKAKPQAA